MNVTELHPQLRARAVPVPDHGGCYAVVPLLVPEQVDVPTCAGLFSLARGELRNLSRAIERYPDSDLLLWMLNRREAVESSQIEGTHTDFDGLVLYEMEAVDGDVETESNSDASETLAYVRAFMYGSAQVAEGGQSVLTENLIRGIHLRLMERQHKFTPGEYRHVQNRIGGVTFETATFIPAPPGAIAEAMANLEGLLQYQPEGNLITSILMRAAIAHVQFEAIHPFTDGNGRTGRMLLPLMLQAEGEPPIHLATFLKVRRNEYYAALLDVQMKLNWTPWMKLFLECVIASCRHTVQLIDQLSTMKQVWQATLRKLGRRQHATVWRLLDVLPGRPILTVKETAKLLNVTFPAANGAIEDLVAQGILREITTQQRYRVFQSHQVLNALYTGMDAVLAEASRDGRLE